ncbi:MAG TPA: phospholipase D-like domain-containing protein, partial [Cyclobacteriaceae bacterium]
MIKPPNHFCNGLPAMDELIAYLENSIRDEVFSKNEKKEFKSLVNEALLDPNQLNFLRSKMYELASARVTPTNYQFILDWIKVANSALIPTIPSAADAFFSPGEACRNVIIQQIESAIQQLQICVFTISDDRITSSLLTAHQKGVNIKLITDNDKSWDEGSDVEQLAHAGITVRMDKTSNHMHHK